MNTTWPSNRSGAHGPFQHVGRRHVLILSPVGIAHPGAADRVDRQRHACDGDTGEAARGAAHEHLVGADRNAQRLERQAGQELPGDRADQRHAPYDPVDIGGERHQPEPRGGLRKRGQRADQAGKFRQELARILAQDHHRRRPQLGAIDRVEGGRDRGHAQHHLIAGHGLGHPRIVVRQAAQRRRKLRRDPFDLAGKDRRRIAVAFGEQDVAGDRAGAVARPACRTAARTPSAATATGRSGRGWHRRCRRW